MSSRNRQKGFTLLELLISVALISVIALIVTGVMRLAYRSVESGEKKSVQLERTRTVLSLFDAQIQSALPEIADKDGAKKELFTGQAGSLTLATNYSLWAGQRGYVVATYTIEAGEDGKQSLRLSEQTPDIENRREILLLQGYDEMSFSYFSRDQDSSGSWTASWTDATERPELVTLTMKKENRSFAITAPLRVRGQEAWINPAGSGAVTK